MRIDRTPHYVSVRAALDAQNMWVITVTGVTAGVTINPQSDDDMEIQFKLDSTRFFPVLLCPDTQATVSKMQERKDEIAGKAHLS